MTRYIITRDAVPVNETFILRGNSLVVEGSAIAVIITAATVIPEEVITQSLFLNGGRIHVETKQNGAEA